MSKNPAIAEIRRVLALEARALKRLESSVDERCAKAVDWMAACRGKVVLTGIGKSGLVAQKIAATLSSTGTPALFLDAAEALHGGLGVVQRADLVLAVGKSGESEELTALLPALRARKVRLIAITENTRSTLAKAADLVLETPNDGEACPLNLAPTTSTTVAMALGDALAVALMKRRGFKPEHFAANHPAGRLGKRLSLRVRDVMRAGADNPTVPVGASTRELLARITRLQAGAATIVDARGRLVGLVTDYDLRRALAEGGDVMSRPIRAIMNAKPTTIGPDAAVAEAIAIMEERRTPFNVLPVVDARGRAVGLVQVHDLRARGSLTGDVVLLSSVDWNATWQRFHVFAEQWARAGRRVFFVENTGFREPERGTCGAWPESCGARRGPRRSPCGPWRASRS